MTGEYLVVISARYQVEVDPSGRWMPEPMTVWKERMRVYKCTETLFKSLKEATSGLWQDSTGRLLDDLAFCKGKRTEGAELIADESSFESCGQSVIFLSHTMDSGVCEN